jgi:hypothetical protein
VALELEVLCTVEDLPCSVVEEELLCERLLDDSG